MIGLLENIPDSLQQRIDSGEITQADVLANTMHLHDLLDRYAIDSEDALKIEQLLKPPPVFNPNAKVPHKSPSRNNLFRFLPEDSFMGLLLQDKARAGWIPALLSCGFDLKNFPQNHFVLAAASGSDTQALAALLSCGAAINEEDKNECNALFAAIDAKNPEMIHALSEGGIDGMKRGKNRIRRGYVVLTPFEYAVRFRFPKTDESVLLALLEEGWGSIHYEQERNLIFTHRHEVVDVPYKDALKTYINEQTRAADEATSAISEGKASPSELGAKQFRQWWSVGVLDRVLQPHLWQGHEKQLLHIYQSLPEHIQADMGQIMPLLAALLAKSYVVQVPVSQSDRMQPIAANKEL